MPIVLLQPGAEDVQRIHIESNVHERAVQQHGREQTPPLPRRDQHIHLHAQRRRQVESQQQIAAELADIDQKGQGQQGVGDDRTPRLPAHHQAGPGLVLLRAIFRRKGRSHRRNICTMEVSAPPSMAASTSMYGSSPDPCNFSLSRESS